MRVDPKITNQEIIGGATKIFGEMGYSNADIRDIAKEARVSETTVYRLHGPKITDNLPKHKATKEKIALHLCELTDTVLLKIWSETIADKEKSDLLKTFFTQICELIKTDQDFKVGLQLQDELSFQGGVVEIMYSFFVAKQKEGLVRSDIVPQNMVRSLFSILQESVKKDGISSDQCNIIIQILLDGFGARSQ